MVSRSHQGRDCFRVFYSRLTKEYENEKRGDRHPPMAPIHVLNEVYMRFYREHEAELGHYFRSLYNTVKLVHESNVQDKRLYTNLVEAQLSSYELLVVFYNCLSEMGREKFKPLVIEYELLKHLSRTELLDPTHPSLY
jgi:Putative phage abortive infection protein